MRAQLNIQYQSIQIRKKIFNMSWKQINCASHTHGLFLLYFSM